MSKAFDLSQFKKQANTVNLSVTGNTALSVLSANTVSATDVAASSFNSGPLGGFRNKIINGGFDIWQRGTTNSSSAFARQYGPDRWFTNASGTGTPTITLAQSTFTPGQTNVSGEPRHALRVTQTTTGTFTNIYLTTLLEDVRTLAGKTATLSYYIRTTSGTGNFYVNALQDFGSGGSSTVATTIDNTFTANTSWQKRTATITLPSISGKTIGSNSSLGLYFYSPLTTIEFEIANVQLEEGPVATPFESRPIGVELALCQRYFFKTFPQSTAPAQNAGTAGAITTDQAATTAINMFNLQYPVQMRVSPTVTIFNPSASNAQLRNVTLGADASSTAINTTQSSARNVSIDAVGGGSVGHTVAGHITAEAEL